MLNIITGLSYRIFVFCFYSIRTSSDSNWKNLVNVCVCACDLFLCDQLIDEWMRQPNILWLWRKRWKFPLIFMQMKFFFSFVCLLSSILLDKKSSNDWSTCLFHSLTFWISPFRTLYISLSNVIFGFFLAITWSLTFGNICALRILSLSLCQNLSFFSIELEKFKFRIWKLFLSFSGHIFVLFLSLTLPSVIDKWSWRILQKPWEDSIFFSFYL